MPEIYVYKYFFQMKRATPRCQKYILKLKPHPPRNDTTPLKHHHGIPFLLWECCGGPGNVVQYALLVVDEVWQYD